MIASLVNTYYDGLSARKGWENPLAETFRFVSPGNRVTDGKPAYVAANTGFLGLVTSARRKEMLTDGDTACVWMTYDLQSPRGARGALDAVEIWTAAGDKLTSLTLHFDTAAFQKFMQG